MSDPLGGLTMRRSLVGLTLLPIALVACGDDEATTSGSGGASSSSASSVSVSVAVTVTAAGTGGESSSGGGEDGGGAAGAGTGEGGEGAGGRDGGDGGAGGRDGSGGAGAGDQGGGGGGSTGSGDPIDCAVCVATDCPQIAECIADPVCAEGLVCTLTGCIADGAPDLQCISECFGGDFEAALGALEALGCVVTTCGDACGGLIPSG
jgi:hypothetical protein